MVREVIHPKNRPQIKPKPARKYMFSILLDNIPALNPIRPQAIIWNMVQYPNPKKRSEINAVKTPAKKPVFSPKTTPAIIIIKEAACMLGIPAEGILPREAIATIMATSTKYSTSGFESSNDFNKIVIIPIINNIDKINVATITKSIFLSHLLRLYYLVENSAPSD